MIRETFKNQYRGWGTGKKKPDGEVLFIMRSHGHVLSPSWDLWNDWLLKNRRKTKMTWHDYTRGFIEEMKHPAALKEIRPLAGLSHSMDIWLVCSCWNSRKECHRYLILDLIREAGGLVTGGD